MSTIFNCPGCGIALLVDTVGQSNWTRSQEFAFGKAVPAGSEYSREVPAANVANIEGGVKLPLAQALLITMAVVMLTTLITVVKGWAWTIPVSAGIVAFALSLWLLVLDSRRLLRKVETLVGADLDGDGKVGFAVEITDLTDGKRQMCIRDSPCRPEYVRRFAQAAIGGTPTPEGAAMGRRKFNAIRDEALRRGLLAWKDRDHHAQGLETTLVGKAVFRRLLEETLD